MKPLNEVTPQELAREFTRLLHAELSPREIRQVKLRNALEKNPDICHSHDFCDANVVMDEAIKNLTGTAATDTPPGDQAGCMSNECLSLCNAAWGIAKKNLFRNEP